MFLFGLFRPMLVKYYTDYYNLDLCYRFNISEPKKTENWEFHQVITLYFPANAKNWWQDIIYFTSAKDKDTYDKIVGYVLNNKEVIAEYNDLEQFIE